MNFFESLFSGGNRNPAKAAQPYLNQIPSQTNQYMLPYFNAGTGALPNLQQQYSQLLSSPGELINHIGESYQQSPGLNFAIKQAMQGAGRASAAGGMAGSPMHEQENMKLAQDLGMQDYNRWLGNALGMYGTGLAGEQGLAGMGQHAGQSMADMIAQTLAQQGNLAFQGQAQQNQNRNDFWGNLFSGAGSLAAFNPWGVFGNI